MIKKLRCSILSASLFMFSSCVVFRGSFTIVNTTDLPSYRLSAPNGNVVLVNHFDFEKLKIKNNHKLELIKQGVLGGFNALGQHLAELSGGRYDNLADTGKLAVNTDTVNSLAAKYGAAYVVSLTNFDYFVMLDQVVKTGGNKQAYFSLRVVAWFTVYNAEGQKLQEFKGDINAPFYNNESLGWLVSSFATPSIKRNIPAFNTIVANAFYNGFRDFFPRARTFNAIQFSDVALRPALKESRAGNLDRAKTLLEPLLGGIDEELAGKAAFNLAVVYCLMSRFDKARAMAEMSVHKFDNPDARKLLADLAVREVVSL